MPSIKKETKNYFLLIFKISIEWWKLIKWSHAISRKSSPLRHCLSPLTNGSCRLTSKPRDNTPLISPCLLHTLTHKPHSNHKFPLHHPLADSMNDSQKPACRQTLLDPTSFVTMSMVPILGSGKGSHAWGRKWVGGSREMAFGLPSVEY